MKGWAVDAFFFFIGREQGQLGALCIIQLHDGRVRHYLLEATEWMDGL